MKQKRDAKGKFVKMYLTREEYEDKIAELKETIDSLSTKCTRAINEASLWKQEFDRVQRLHRQQEISIKKVTSMRNWLYENVGFITKYRYHRAKEKGLL